MAKEIAGIGTKASLNFAVQVSLSPSRGGQATKTAQITRYRKSVRAAVLRIKLTDETSLQQWNSTKRPVRSKTVQTFLNRLKAKYPNAVRSVTMVDANEKVLAMGDSTGPGRAAVSIF